MAVATSEPSAIGTVLARLYALSKRGARRDLEGMREACAADGDPQARFPSVHVAGTNGKGSVSATLEAIARAAGLRTGLYTSPHLQRFAERIRLDGEPIDDGALAHHLGAALERHPQLTFFEVATLAAFHAFAQAHVDLAVVEVGLGGRLDATNVLERPRATAVTSIALDHTEWLGDTLEAIAGEKAAIAKAGVPMVTGPLPAPADAVVRAVVDGRLLRVGHEIAHAFDGERLRVRGPTRETVVVPALAGAHQHDNTAIAVALAWELGLDDAAIARGVAHVRWPGRLEELRTDDGVVLLDGAHNEEGVRALVLELARRPRPRALVFGAMGDKSWRTMATLLAPQFDARVYVAPDAAGAGRAVADPDALRALDPQGRRASGLREALELARAAVGPSGLVVVAGSLYLVGQARAQLRGEPRDPQVGL